MRTTHGKTVIVRSAGPGSKRQQSAGQRGGPVASAGCRDVNHTESFFSAARRALLAWHNVVVWFAAFVTRLWSLHVCDSFFADTGSTSVIGTRLVVSKETSAEYVVDWRFQYPAAPQTTNYASYEVMETDKARWHSQFAAVLVIKFTGIKRIVAKTLREESIHIVVQNTSAWHSILNDYFCNKANSQTNVAKIAIGSRCLLTCALFRIL